MLTVFLDRISHGEAQTASNQKAVSYTRMRGTLEVQSRLQRHEISNTLIAKLQMA